MVLKKGSDAIKRKQKRRRRRSRHDFKNFFFGSWRAGHYASASLLSHGVVNDPRDESDEETAEIVKRVKGIDAGGGQPLLIMIVRPFHRGCDILRDAVGNSVVDSSKLLDRVRRN